MAFEAYEHMRSRRQSDTYAELNYVVKATGDDILNEQGAKAAAWAQCRIDLGTPEGQAATYNGLSYSDTDMDEYRGGGWYFITIKWGTQPLSYIEQGLSDFWMDTTHGTRKVQAGLAHIADFPAVDPADAQWSNYNGLINVSADGDTVGGVDWPAPGMSFGFTWVMPVGVLTSSYVDMIYFARGCVNSTPWTPQVALGVYKTFGVREAMFMGMKYRQPVGGLIATFWDFMASPTLTNQTICGVPGVTKAGMDYMWPQYGPSVASAAAGGPLNVLSAWSVERIAFEYDFNLFGIPM